MRGRGYFKYGALEVTDESPKGRVGNALSKSIAYERDPSIFDEEEVRKRDEDIRALQKLKEDDITLCIDRKDKPVVLTSYQSRIVHALSYALSMEIETSEDIRSKIKDPLKRGNRISRDVNITAITALIFGSTRKRYKDIVIKELMRLSRISQVQEIGLKRFYAPLIMIGDQAEDLSKDGIENSDYLEIIFGNIFFVGLNKRFAVITPKLFEVWNKSGRGTELFSKLLSSIFSVYWHYRQAANEAERRIIGKRDKYKLSKEVREAIAEARRNAMTYELNTAAIKKRVATDYESKRSYKARFYKDLQNAIDGFKELDLIKEGIIQRGARGQEKVIFILSESYNFSEKPGGAAPLLEDKTEDGEAST